MVNMAFLGTVAVYGRLRRGGVHGQASEMGKIAWMPQEAKAEPVAAEKLSSSQPPRLRGRVALSSASGYSGAKTPLSVPDAVSLAVAAIPEGFWR
jgi:hypothetical protein